MANDIPDERYVVEMTGIAREQLRAILRRALRVGGESVIADAYDRIVARLEADARAVGDPIHRLRRIHMDVLHFVDFPLYVQYGIPNGRRVAIIRRFVRMSGPVA